MLGSSFSSIREEPGLRRTCLVVQLTTAEGKWQRAVLLDSQRIRPDARAAETGFEALDTDNGKDEPEEANEKRNIDQQGRCFLQAS